MTVATDVVRSESAKEREAYIQEREAYIRVSPAIVHGIAVTDSTRVFSDCDTTELSLFPFF